MLVTFSCSVYADITMFGDVAVRLIKMMGHSGTVPGAILADEVQDALESLVAAVKEEKQLPNSESSEDEGEREPVVALAHRAFPLIELLEAAAKAHSNVMWEKYH